MGSSTVSLWQQAVKLLGDGTQTPPDDLGPVISKLHSLPPPPKAVWKKLVQQLQVPLHIGRAFSTACQHSCSSPATSAGISLLKCMLSAATDSGIMKADAAAGSLCSTMGQQLQEAAVLQHYAAVVAGLTADLRDAAASFAQMGWEEMCADIDRFFVWLETVGYMSRPYPCFSTLWRSLGQPDSGHVEAAMQLCTAALQHISTVLQHVLPAVQQRVPREAAALRHKQHKAVAAAMELGDHVMGDLMHAARAQAAASSQHGHPSTDSSLGVQAQQQQQQQALMSPHCLPFAVAVLVVNASWVSWSCSQQAASASQGQGGARNRSSSSSSSSSNGCDSSGRDKGRQHAAAAAARGGTSSSRAFSGGMPTGCQQQLLELLGLSPQLTGMAGSLLKADAGSHTQLVAQLTSNFEVFAEYHQAVVERSQHQEQHNQLEGGEEGDQEQRWRFEQQLWLLLPSVLLPCAHSLLQMAAVTRNSHRPYLREQLCVEMLIKHSQEAHLAYNRTYLWLEGTSFINIPSPQQYAWMKEVLGQVLHLADQLLLQQPRPGAPAPVAPTAGVATPGGSSAAAHTAVSSSSSYRAWAGNLQAESTWQLLRLPSGLVFHSLGWFPNNTTEPRPCELSTENSSAATCDAAALAAFPASPMAEKFVQVCTALEAAVRALTAAVQQDVWKEPAALAACMEGLLDGAHNKRNRSRSVLVLHLGLCGPEALALEERQLYSLLSTVQKLSRCQAGGEVGLGQQAAGGWGWGTAESAVRLLQSPLLAAGPGAAATAGLQDQATTLAVVQQPRVMVYLPSLVIFGRCCLGWAEHLKQQQADAAADADVLLPQTLSAKVQQQGPRFQQLLATVSSWVGGAIMWSPAACAALAAAARGNVQQLSQQFDALSAAWQAAGQGLDAATLAALVHQLQATGVMLSGIAMPHFCNNPACGNISGPTDVQLVSGRSCLCAGCRTARYCGRGCQRAAWKQHKPVCKALAAAAAAGAQV